MKRVYLISNYFHFKQEKSSNRYRELAEMLSSLEDVEVTVITSKFYQRSYKHRTNFDELTKDIPFKAVFTDELGYDKSICLKRLVSSKSFANSVMKYLKSAPRPDLIYQVVPTLDVASKVSRFANKNNIPLVVDVQDLWPEAFKMAIDIPVVSDIAFLPMKLQANGIYKRADRVCAVSETYVERVLSVNKKCSSGQAVFIGINLKNFDKYAAENKVEKSDRLRLAYCGSLSKSYNIKMVIDALSMMKNPPELICMGDGNDRQYLENYAKEKGVDAVFTGFIEYSKMCGMLCSCDITVNPILGKSVASIINKHGDYAASGLPVLNTQESAEYKKLVTDYNMGFNCKSDDAESLAEKIEILCSDAQLREEMGKNARRCAEEKFDRAHTYLKLVDTVRALL